MTENNSKLNPTKVHRPLRIYTNELKTQLIQLYLKDHVILSTYYIISNVVNHEIIYSRIGAIKDADLVTKVCNTVQTNLSQTNHQFTLVVFSAAKSLYYQPRPKRPSENSNFCTTLTY